MISRQKLVFLIVIALILLSLVLRNSMLNLGLRWKIGSLQTRANLAITYKHAAFSGLKTIRMNGVRMVSLPSDTLLTLDTLEINPRILPLIFSKKRIHSFTVHGMKASLNSALLELWLNRRKQVSDTLKEKEIRTETDYASTLGSLESKLFVTIPDRMEVRNASFTYYRDTLYSAILCRQFQYAKDNFAGDFIISDNVSRQDFRLSGSISKSKHSLSALLSQSGKKKVKIPYIGPRWNAEAGFDSLSFSLAFVKAEGGRMKVDGSGEVKDLVVSHRKIGPQPVMIRNGGIRFHLLAARTSLELDSSTMLNMNGFEFSPYVRYDLSPMRVLTFGIVHKEFFAQSLFDALPDGLFMSFKGMQTKGSLDYQLKGSVNFDYPDSVTLFSRLRGHDFYIAHYGQTDFRMINEPFVHEVYQDDQYVKSILVGPENPDYVPLNRISPYLQYAVLTGEDGGFFSHRGFSIDAIRESIAEDMKQKRFARGGSTLTMQLVKNVFLNSKKTISRKLEEILIVWIIENERLVSKERMFEVYLNIIEWGPDIYGIKQASRYYFDKDPWNLNLKESIFLSAIIPRPKGFRYNFVKNGELKPYLADYYRIVSEFMLRRGQIQPSDTVHLDTRLTLQGNARYMITTRDTTQTDTLIEIPPRAFIPASPGE